MTTEQEGQALIPVEQDEIDFRKRKLVAVRLMDDRICVIIRWMCDILGLDPTAQVRRIKRTKAIADELVYVQVETKSGEQVMPALTLRALPFWLAGVDTKRLNPELEPIILAFQREVVEVLYLHFAQKRQALAEPKKLVPSEKILKPEPPTQDATADLWLAYHEQMVIFLRWQRELETGIEERFGQIETRLEGVEEVTRLVPEILERLAPPTLSPEHQRTVQASINRLHDLSGQSHAALYNDLREDFKVGTYKDIPDARWGDVMAWFQARFNRIRKPGAGA